MYNLKNKLKRKIYNNNIKRQIYKIRYSYNNIPDPIQFKKIKNTQPNIGPTHRHQLLLRHHFHLHRHFLQLASLVVDQVPS